MLGKTEPTLSCQEELSPAGQLKNEALERQRRGGEKTPSPLSILVFTPVSEVTGLFH